MKPASEAERTAYLSIIGSLLFVGAVSHPIALAAASLAARHSKSLLVKHIIALNSTLEMLKKTATPLIFLRPPQDYPAALKCFGDASHAYGDFIHPHIGVIVFRTFSSPNSDEEIAHIISYSSHKGRRVSRSTLATEAHAKRRRRRKRRQGTPRETFLTNPPGERVKHQENSPGILYLKTT